MKWLVSSRIPLLQDQGQHTMVTSVLYLLKGRQYKLCLQLFNLSPGKDIFSSKEKITPSDLCTAWHFTPSNLLSLPGNYQALESTYTQPSNLPQRRPSWASLVDQWLRIQVPMQGTQVRPLVWEDPTCWGATKPLPHNYWACALEWELLLRKPMLCGKRSHSNEKPMHRSRVVPIHRH